jgi:hypothetical protein
LLLIAGVSLLAALAVADALRSEESPRSLATASTGTEESSTFAATPPRLSAEEDIEQIGNSWAPLFAAGNAAGCFHMTQPACERIACAHVGGSKIPNCTPLTPAFMRSFREATVQDIVIRKGYRAMATFSNRELVEFFGDGGTWWVHRLGEDVDREFFE